MSRFVVTGGLGFIGSNLCRRLALEGHQVISVDNLPFEEGRALGRLMPDVFYKQADLRDPESLKRVLRAGDNVFHLAADMGGVGYFHKHDYYPAMDNAQMSMNVLQACEKANVNRLMFTSSACSYPIELQQTVGVAPLLSEDLIESGTPDQMYGREKLWTLRLCERAPFDARVGVLHTVYGPLQEREGERMKFPPAVATKALKALETEEPLVLWGNGTQLRSYLYVDDAVDRILKIFTSDVYEGPVNVGATGAISCLDVARLCLNLVGLDGDTYPIELDPTEPTGVISRDCDNTKYNRLYGVGPQRPYTQGFSNLIEWLIKTS